MVDPRTALQRQLAWAVHAYGPDCPLPPGTALPRAAAAAAIPATTAPEVPAPDVPAAPIPAAQAESPAARPATEAPGALPASPAAPRAPAPVRAGPAEPAPLPASAPTELPAAAAAAADAAAADPAAALAALRAEVLPCTRCKLCEGRDQVVFGEGNPRAEVMFVGEAPGAQEDRTGRPFVGDAGQLLDRIITHAMGMARADVYIANINKCRPPGNRDPEPDEVAACLPYLQRQVAIVRPKVIVCLGRVAAQNLLRTTATAGALRGRELSYEGIPVVVTWHPAYLLREPDRKAETWADIKRTNRLLGRPEVPPRPGS